MTDKDKTFGAIAARHGGLDALLDSLLDDVRGTRQRIMSLRVEFDRFRAETHEDFAAIKASLHRIEIAKHEKRISALEARPQDRREH